MAGHWMDEGEVDVINLYLKTQTLYLGLFTAPVEGSLTEDMSITDLTEVPVASGGYERQALASGDWSLVDSVASQPYKQFDFTAGATVLGYFITVTSAGTSGATLLAVVYFDNSIAVVSGNFIQAKAEIEVK